MAKKVVPGSITKAYQKREGDFAPDLVGFQFTKSTSLFTLGNFSLTTNNDTLTAAVFNSGTFSEPYTLDSLNLTEQESVILANNSSNSLKVNLKNNKSNFLSYVYFGSATKFLETEISEIILNWKGSLYLRKSSINTNVTNFSYNSNKGISTFRIPTNLVTNVFNLDTRNDAQLKTDVNDLSDIVNKYSLYEIQNDYGKFKVVGYTGDTDTVDYLTVSVDGFCWPTLSATTTGSFTYHLRPTDEALDMKFFKLLSDFQNQLLDRTRIPKYTLQVEIPYYNNLGYMLTKVSEHTWPTTDGYNIDISGRNYLEYLQPLFDNIKFLDSEKTNLMTRRLVSTSILEFDTAGDGTTTTGRKMDKMLKIWGREYDEVKKYIDGISFANVVTYDGKDNMPDELVKMLASNLGFDTIQSFSDNDLINYLVSTTNVVFSGNSKSMSIQEIDTELWRRLVINAWWLFKSKGTRKVIEFFLNLFQIDECLIDLDEFVYLAEQKLDYDDVVNKVTNYLIDRNQLSGFEETAEFNDLVLPIDEDGYPRILPDSPDYYFQMDGFWYDGGVPANTKPDLNGNNPHFGPYDFGRSYFDRFRCFITDFEVTTNTVNLNELTFNYFNDYSLGTVEGTGSETVTITDDSLSTNNNDNILTSYNTFYGGVMTNDNRITTGSTVTSAGSSTEQSNTGNSSFKISFSNGNEDSCRVCPPNIKFGDNGEITFTDELGEQQVLTDGVCCSSYGYNSYINRLINKLSCYWCPPFENFQEETVILDTKTPIGNLASTKNLIKPITYTHIVYRTPEGTLEIPTKSCCLLRDGEWDELNKRCVPKKTTTVVSVRDGLINTVRNNGRT